MSVTPQIGDRDERKRYLPDEMLKVSSEFINSPVWAAMKQAIMARTPEDAVTTDEPHVAAAKGFRVAAWRQCVEEFERIPFERLVRPTEAIPATLTDTAD